MFRPTTFAPYGDLGRVTTKQTGRQSETANLSSKVLTRSKTMILWSNEKDNGLDVHIAGPTVGRSVDQLPSAKCKNNSSKMVIYTDAIRHSMHRFSSQTGQPGSLYCPSVSRSSG
jgi:hypothetical protein